MATYREMTEDHLGDETTEADLAEFVLACERRQRETGESDAEVTDWMWGNGDFLPRVAKYVDISDD